MTSQFQFLILDRLVFVVIFFVISNFTKLEGEIAKVFLSVFWQAANFAKLLRGGEILRENQSSGEGADPVFFFS